MTSNMTSMTSNMTGSLAAVGAVAALALLAGPMPAAGEVNPLQELLRKVEAKETEDGFCKTVDWPKGDNRATYVAWLNGAAAGFGKVNKFASGTCQYDEVVRVFMRDGRRCVEYRWHACQPERTCGRGSDTECKSQNGEWNRVKK